MVRQSSLACLCWVFLGFQEIHAGIDHSYLSHLWLSGLPPVFSPDFSKLGYKRESSEQAVQPFLFSHLHLDALTVKKILVTVKMTSLLFLVLISVCWAEPHPDNSSLEHERIIHIQGKEIH